MSPRWTILIACCRENGLRHLVSVLMPQVDAYGGAVTVLGLWNHGGQPVGCYRQQLLVAAESEYICFIDDDDTIPLNYCQQIMKALEGSPDFVGFTVRIMEGEHFITRPAIHSITYDGWAEARDALYRHCSHLNPVRRELALHGCFDDQGVGEDRRWAEAVWPHLKSEVFIEQDMYYYCWDPANSTYQDTVGRSLTSRPDINSPNFYWHPRSLP